MRSYKISKCFNVFICILNIQSIFRTNKVCWCFKKNGADQAISAQQKQLPKQNKKNITGWVSGKKDHLTFPFSVMLLRNLLANAYLIEQKWAIMYLCRWNESTIWQMCFQQI